MTIQELYLAIDTLQSQLYRASCELNQLIDQYKVDNTTYQKGDIVVTTVEYGDEIILQCGDNSVTCSGNGNWLTILARILENDFYGWDCWDSPEPDYDNNGSNSDFDYFADEY